MSATTRSNGYNWRLKLLTVVTCTACSVNPDSIKLAATTCTVVGGFDNISGLKGTFAETATTSFEDGMAHSVLGVATYGPVTGSGTYDPVETSQKALIGEVFHEIGVAAASGIRPTSRVWAATDTVNKRKHTFKGTLKTADITVGALGKATISFEIMPDSIPQVCTTA